LNKKIILEVSVKAILMNIESSNEITNDNKDEKDKDNKVMKQSTDDPDINKLDHRGLWQHVRH
jgi:hypothetical protein